MDSSDEMIIINILKIGTIVSNPSSTRPCPLFTRISYKPTVRLFKDTSTHDPENKSPNLLIVQNTDAAKSVAFQMLDETIVCDRICYLSQYDRVLLCEVNEENSISDVTDTSIFNELPSGATMFLQMSIDKALSQLLFFACQQRKQDLLVTLGNFESLGWKLAGTPRGVVGLELGERGLLLS